MFIANKKKQVKKLIFTGFIILLPILNGSYAVNKLFAVVGAAIAAIIP